MNSITTVSGEWMLVAFKLGRAEFAAPIDQVLEIIRLPTLTRMPRAPQYVIGLMNLRGKVFPVVDLKRRFGLPDTGLDTDMRVMVVESEGQIMGLLVDEVREVIRTPLEKVEEPPAMMVGNMGAYLHGVVKAEGRLLLLLDLDLLFLTEEPGSAPAEGVAHA
jgi:purine-binding chemotaxis protein CheW